MPWTEFCTLVGGLLPDTPLGQIVSIRAESDMETIRQFSSEQKRIYSSWKDRQLEKLIETPESIEEKQIALQNMIASMFQ